MSDAPAPASSRPAKPRFSWPMRIFLFLVVFNMVFRSLSILFPWDAWMKELDMRGMPTRMPAKGEVARLAADASAENPHPVFDRFMTSADSVWEYWRPWPGKKTRRKMHAPSDWGKFAYCWLSSRYDFVERVLGVNQEWPMFSPTVSDRRKITRVRLHFEDGSERIVRQTGDPEDLTNYSRWFCEKFLDFEMHVLPGAGRVDDCVGYCNFLTHRFRRNEKDSPLAKIELFQIYYVCCPPGEDPMAHYREQAGPPPEQVSPTFFSYDVASKKGRMLP